MSKAIDELEDDIIDAYETGQPTMKDFIIMVKHFKDLVEQTAWKEAKETL